MADVKERWITVCPKCGSTDVSADFSNPVGVVTGRFQNFKICNHCGYDSMIFPEVPESKVQKPKDLKDVEKRTLVDVGYGQGVTHFWWKIVGPIGLVLNIYMYLINPFNLSETFLSSVILFYSLPLAVFIMSYAYGRNYFEKYNVLRILGVIMLLYGVVGYYLLPILFK